MIIKPRVATVTIYQGDDLEQLGRLRAVADRARARMDEAKASGAMTLGDGPPDPQDDEDAFGAFLDEAAERAEQVVLHSIGQAHRDLRLAHPPRKVTVTLDGEEIEQVHEDDVEVGVNTETYPMAVLMYADPEDEEVRTVAAPTFAGEAGLRKFLKSLPEGDFDKLWLSAYHLNKEFSIDPKGLRYSSAALT